MRTLKAISELSADHMPNIEPSVNGGVKGSQLAAA